MRRAHAPLRRAARRGAKGARKRSPPRSASWPRRASSPPPRRRPRSAASRSSSRWRLSRPARWWSRRSSRSSAPSRQLFVQLESRSAADCILASNTSSLSVTAMAAACQRPERVAGYHFFNPVPVMKIVEVVAGVRTEPWVVEALDALAKRFGHTPVRCKDTPGFIVNHAGRAFVPESLRVLSRGHRRLRHHRPHPGRRRGLSHRAVRPDGPGRARRRARGDEVDVPAVLRGAEVPPLLPRRAARRRRAPRPQDRPRLVHLRQGRRRRAGRRAESAARRSRRRCGSCPSCSELFAKFKRRSADAAPTTRRCASSRPLGRDATTTAQQHRPRPGAHGGDRPAVRLRQAAHADDHAGHPARGARRGARPARFRRRAGLRHQRLAGIRRAARGRPHRERRLRHRADAHRHARRTSTARWCSAWATRAARSPWATRSAPHKVLAILESMHDFYQEPRYRPSPWLRRRAQLGVSLLTPE